MSGRGPRSGSPGRGSAGNACPEAEMRAALSDEDFWAHVFPQVAPAPEDLEDEHLNVEVTSLNGEPCPECESVGACAYDGEGRPLIHAASARVGEDA